MIRDTLRVKSCYENNRIQDTGEKDLKDKKNPTFIIYEGERRRVRSHCYSPCTFRSLKCGPRTSNRKDKRRTVRIRNVPLSIDSRVLSHLLTTRSFSPGCAVSVLRPTT